MGRHSKPVLATDNTDVEDWLTQAAEWVVSGEPEQAAFCEEKAVEAGCTEEDFGEYVIGLAAMLVRLGRTEEALALASSDDVPYLQTSLGSLKMSTSLGEAFRESGDAESACRVLVNAEQRVVTLFEKALPSRTVARHTLELTRAMKALL